MTPELNKQPIEIERAVPDDAEAILAIKRDAWLATYPNKEHGITVDDIYKHFPPDDSSSIKNWQEAIANETETGPRVTFVAKVGERIVGYTSPGLKDGRQMLGAMYVAPDAQHNGVGSALIKQALSCLGTNKDIFVSVVSYNQRAIKFYEHYGFEKTGVELPEEIDAQGLKLLPEIEMVRKAKA